MIAIGNDKMFTRFCKIIGDEKIAKSKLFFDNNLRNKNLIELRNRIEITLKKKENFGLIDCRKIKYLVHK